MLRPGGRLVMLEPAITPLSWPGYAFVHPEPVALSADPLPDGPGPAPRDPGYANQAVPTLLFGPVFGRYRARFRAAFPGLGVETARLLGLFAYPLSGGFKRWSLVPTWLVPALVRFEDWLLPVLGPLMATRMLVVLERR